MRLIPSVSVLLWMTVVSGCLAQQFELGGSVGYALQKKLDVTSSAGTAKASFEPALAFSVFGGSNVTDLLGGEARYTYRFGSAKVESGGRSFLFDARSHVIHYDFLLHTSGRRARVRPFFALGGGIRIFEGTGQQSAVQPFNRFVVPTRTTEWTGLLSAGAGVKVRVSDLMYVRFDFRDFMSPTPKEVLFPAPGATVSGWIHDFTGMFGFGFVF